jgi:DNA-binding NarL/FixJ family response regulator
MALPVVVADDSALARKILINALPEDWDIEIHQASSGAQALEHYHEGRAAVMFLDLTMPDLDGYQVLAQLKREDLNVFVIVVSADIQPGAVERVKQLGAIAFVKKPASADKLVPILKEYGLYE